MLMPSFILFFLTHIYSENGEEGEKGKGTKFAEDAAN